MVGQGLPGHLAAGDAAAVGEGRKKERVDRSPLLQDVEDLRRAFIDERHRPHLHPDHLLRGRRRLDCRG
jgi:hypothetical protein